tara:strand:- start:118 stop:339 length:222 start_codon:yes stop_codon:yes gene_type:complete
VSEIEAHQIICLVIGAASGACVAMFATTLNPGFMFLNFIVLLKVQRGVRAYDSTEVKNKTGKQLLLCALWRLM